MLHTPSRRVTGFGLRAHICFISCPSISKAHLAPQATHLSRTLALPVLTHTTKKPGCHPSILGFFLSDPATGVTHPSQIAIVGDRLFTDIMMANMMGSWGLWIRDGVVQSKSLFGGVETVVEGYLRGRGLRAPWPGVVVE